MLKMEKSTVYKYSSHREEQQYLDLIRDILNKGSVVEGRNGKTKSIFGAAHMCLIIVSGRVGVGWRSQPVDRIGLDRAWAKEEYCFCDAIRFAVRDFRLTGSDRIAPVPRKSTVFATRSSLP